MSQSPDYPKYTDLKKAFIRAIRPLFKRELPEALPAIDAYLNFEWQPKAPKPPKPPKPASPAKHKWEPFEISAELCAEAPKRAQTALRNQKLKGRMCAHCGCVSNCAYPYWFYPDGKGGKWAMRAPVCINPTTDQS